MRVQKMQLAAQFRAWVGRHTGRPLRAVILWAANLVGLELMKPGCRQIPAQHVSFDPALATVFKSADRAIVFGIIDQWNQSNARHSKREYFHDGRWWTAPRGDTWWVNKSAPWMSARTWKRCAADLEATEMLKARLVNGQRVYSTEPYEQTGTRQFVLWGGQNAEGGGQIAVRGRQIADHNSSNTESLFDRIWKRTAAPAHAGRIGAVAVFNTPDPEKNFISGETPDAAAIRDEDETEAAQRRAERRPSPPSSATPPTAWRTGETTLGDSTLDDADGTTEFDDVTREGEDTPTLPLPRVQGRDGADIEELRLFFTGCSADQVQEMIDRHGAARIHSTIARVRGQQNVANPPGLVRALLAMGGGGAWQYPRCERDEGKRYISGKYADFVEH